MTCQCAGQIVTTEVIPDGRYLLHALSPSATREILSTAVFPDNRVGLDAKGAPCAIRQTGTNSKCGVSYSIVAESVGSDNVSAPMRAVLPPDQSAIAVIPREGAVATGDAPCAWQIAQQADGSVLITVAPPLPSAVPDGGRLYVVWVEGSKEVKWVLVADPAAAAPPVIAYWRLELLDDGGTPPPVS